MVILVRSLATYMGQRLHQSTVDPIIVVPSYAQKFAHFAKKFTYIISHTNDRVNESKEALKGETKQHSNVNIF